MTSYTIRTGLTADIDAVLELWRAAAENAQREPDSGNMVATLLERDPEALLIADAAGSVVGSVIAAGTAGGFTFTVSLFYPTIAAAASEVPCWTRQKPAYGPLEHRDPTPWFYARTL